MKPKVLRIEIKIKRYFEVRLLYDWRVRTLGSGFTGKSVDRRK